MKENELRLNNYVLNDERVVLLSTNYDLFKCLVYVNRGIGFEPIQLTEEWLLKFGFTQCENNSWYEKKIPNLNIMVSCNLNGRFCIEHKDNIVTIIDCCYNVHNLQNLYFALTGEELTIKKQEQ